MSEIPLHPTLRAMLDKIAHLPPMHSLSIDEIRAGDPARYAIAPRPPVGAVEDRSIPGPRGPLALRIYRPEEAGRRPIVVFFHGSGFCICSLDTHDGMCRQICRRTGAIVVSVDYALAPEHKFPAGPDDCLTATRWVAKHAVSLGGDPERIAVAGDSAGGTMAAVTALRIRDEESGPNLAGALLMYPVTDHPSAGTPSFIENGDGYGLTAEGMRMFWSHYLNHEFEAANPIAAPNRADSLAGLPPTFVITAGYDPLRDEGEIFADRLAADGVAVTRRRYDDMNHGFMTWIGIVDRSEEAMAEACGWLRERFEEEREG